MVLDMFYLLNLKMFLEIVNALMKTPRSPPTDVKSMILVNPKNILSYGELMSINSLFFCGY